MVARTRELAFLPSTASILKSTSAFKCLYFTVAHILTLVFLVSGFFSSMHD